MLFVLILVFPDGRFVPSWTRWIGYAWVGWMFARLVAVTLDANSMLAPGNSNALTFAFDVAFAIVGLYAQVYRYRNVSTRAQKQQTKWVVYGLAILIAGFVLALLPQYALAAFAPK